MKRFDFSPEARHDLLEIWDFVAKGSVEAADRLLEEIHEGLVRIADSPGIGHLRSDLAREDLRVWRVRSYLVIYRPQTRPIQIVRVVSGYRDLSRLFDER